MNSTLSKAIDVKLDDSELSFIGITSTNTIPVDVITSKTLNVQISPSDRVRVYTDPSFNDVVTVNIIPSQTYLFEFLRKSTDGVTIDASEDYSSGAVFFEYTSISNNTVIEFIRTLIEDGNRFFATGYGNNT